MTRDDLVQLLREARGYVQERANLANGPGEVSAFLARIDAALAAPPAAPPADLVALVREWQAARKPTVLATPGEFLAETFQAAVRRMSAADEALAACRLDVAAAETPAAVKRVQTPNEAEMLRALSDALTGGALGRIREGANSDTGRSDAVAGTNDCPVQRREAGDPDALVGHGGGDGARRGADPGDPLLVSEESGRREAAGDAVTSRGGECPTCGGGWPCSRCTTRAVDLDALKRNLLAAEDEIIELVGNKLGQLHEKLLAYPQPAAPRVPDTPSDDYQRGKRDAVRALANATKKRLTDDSVASLVVALTAADAPAPVADESAWLIERDIDSTLHYWTGRVIDGREIGAWSPNHLDARRFARREDAACMLTWHCDGNGRVAEHMWTPVRPRRALVPAPPQEPPR